MSRPGRPPILELACHVAEGGADECRPWNSLPPADRHQARAEADGGRRECVAVAVSAIQVDPSSTKTPGPFPSREPALLLFNPALSPARWWRPSTLARAVSRPACCASSRLAQDLTVTGWPLGWERPTSTDAPSPASSSRVLNDVSRPSNPRPFPLPRARVGTASMPGEGLGEGFRDCLGLPPRRIDPSAPSSTRRPPVA